jgi:cation-transporting ATPase E
LLALALGVALALALALPAIRSFFELAALDGIDATLILAATLLWLLLVRVAWRRKWLDRFFGTR